MLCVGCTLQVDSPNFGKHCTLKATCVNSDNEPVCKKHIGFTKSRYEDYSKKLLNKKNIEDKNSSILINHPKDIPYKNNKGEIIGFGFVSEEDYENVIKYNWILKESESLTENVIRYLFTSKYMKQNISMNMHELILGKPPDNNIIDHIDNNGINNRRENLRFATYQQNSQNRKKQDGKSSKYIGVHLDKKNKRWNVKFSRKHLGTFNNEKDAGEMYDTYIFITLGKNAKTNGLIKYEDIKNLKVEDILPKPKIRLLPNNICKLDNTFKVEIQYNKIIYLKVEKTLEDAIITLDKFKKIIDTIKAKELKEHYKKQIILNNDGQAIIPIKNKNGEIIEHVFVPNNRWHELMLYSWSKNAKYYSTIINGKLTKLHRYLMNAQTNEIIDHINFNDVQNNTFENLRVNDKSGNSHNKPKKKGASSKYFGVSIQKEKTWLASITKEYTCYKLGIYDNEIKAAIAYNIKAKELYGKFARLNKIVYEDQIKYESEVIKKMKIPRKKVSIYTGIKFNKQLQKWQASVIKNGKSYYIGLFNTEIEAAKAYNIKAIELHGINYYHLNKIEN